MEAGTEKSHARNVWKKFYGEFPPDGFEVDHINRNRSDNRKENLRLATRQENNCNRGTYRNNTSGYKGVWMERKTKTWYVKVKRGATLVFQPASHKLSAVVASRLIRRLLHGEFTCEA